MGSIENYFPEWTRSLKFRLQESFTCINAVFRWQIAMTPCKFAMRRGNSLLSCQFRAAKTQEK